MYVLKKEESPVERPETKASTTSGKKFTRSTTQRMIAGVCGGLANYFNIDVSIIRIAWIVLTIFGGFFLGILAYIVLVIAIPEEKELATPAKVTPKRTK
ncbi:MAG: PspC domain-containing protein [candidate division KSB1 bacterium]|nr:PspC domain-containing protein [candidate division KSB1 bacterium]